MAESSDFPTMTMKLMSLLGWNISHRGMKISKCVDLACPRGHWNTALRFGVERTLRAASLWKGALCMVRRTSPRHIVAQGEIVGKVILAEGRVVVEQAPASLVACCRGLDGHEGGVGDGLHPLAVLLPLLVSQFLFRLCRHVRLLYAHLFGDVQVLVLVDGLDELGRDLGVDGGAELYPLGECHEHLDGIHHVRFLVELLDNR